MTAAPITRLRSGYFCHRRLEFRKSPHARLLVGFEPRSSRLFESHQNKWRTPHQEKRLRPAVLIRIAVLRELPRAV